MVEVVLSGEGKNALSGALMERTLAAVRAVDGAPLLLRGDGDAFSAGLHLAEVASLDAVEMQRFLQGLTELTLQLFRYPGPTVAAVNGHAIAGGLILALVCDHRVGPRAPKARIGLNEIALGLRFPPQILDVVRYRIPAQHHEAVLLRGPLLSPDEALTRGLLDELADDPVSVATERLAAMAALPRAAYAALKGDLRGAVGIDSPEVQRRFLAEVLPVWTGPALKATIAGFLNKGR